MPWTIFKLCSKVRLSKLKFERKLYEIAKSLKQSKGHTRIFNIYLDHTLQGKVRIGNYQRKNLVCYYCAF